MAERSLRQRRHAPRFASGLLDVQETEKALRWPPARMRGLPATQPRLCIRATPKTGRKHDVLFNQHDPAGFAALQ